MPDNLPYPHGFIFTGNAAQGGTYVAPNYGGQFGQNGQSGMAQRPMPQLPSASYDTTNPTYAASQLTNQFTQAMQQRGPQWSADNAMAFWNKMQPAYGAVAQGAPLPQVQQQVSQMAQSVPQQPQPRPQMSPLRDAQAAPPLRDAQVAPPPSEASVKPPATGDAGMVGPGGRSLQQVQGTPFQSAEERDWFYATANKTKQNKPLPQTASGPPGYAASSSGLSRSAMPAAQGATAPISAPDVAQVAQRYGVPADLLARLMNHEGNGAPDYTETRQDSRIQPARWGITMTTARSYGVNDTMQLTPQKAYEIAADYIAKGLRANGGDIAKAFASYMIGQGNVSLAVSQGGNWVANADKIAKQYGWTVSDVLNYLGLTGATARG